MVGDDVMITTRSSVIWHGPTSVCGSEPRLCTCVYVNLGYVHIHMHSNFRAQGANPDLPHQGFDLLTARLRLATRQGSAVPTRTKEILKGKAPSNGQGEGEPPWHLHEGGSGGTAAFCRRSLLGYEDAVGVGSPRLHVDACGRLGATRVGGRELRHEWGATPPT